MDHMPAIRTARERARAELTREITAEARRQLAREGAAALSLRAVARELGMASSALYRYFPSRDELLTKLIVDAYGSLAEDIETAVAQMSATQHRARWVEACRGTRRWASRHPHEYALIYGSPVPGYRAPQATVAPAARVMLTFLSIVVDAVATGSVATIAASPLPARLHDQLQAVAASLAPQLPEDILARVFLAFSQLVGLLSLELFGHFAGSVDPTEPFFAHAVDTMADGLGLR